MSKKKKGRARKGGRVTPKGTRPPGHESHKPAERFPSPYGGPFDGPWDDPWDVDDLDEGDGLAAEMHETLKRAVRSDHPLDLLMLASMMLATVDPRGRNPFDPDDAEPALTITELVDGFIEARGPETDALLVAVGELVVDDLASRRIRKILDGQWPSRPRWLADLAEAEATIAMVGTEVLGDGETLLVGIRAGEHELSAIVAVDHNLGTIVVDAFVAPEEPRKLSEIITARPGVYEYDWRELDPADARARVTDAVDKGAITYPPMESDTWPAARPILEWMARHLPEGGTAWERPDWSDERRTEFTEAFLASEFGDALDDADHRSLLESVLWFGADFGPGDPMRWSPDAVGSFLGDWVPRKIVADADYLSRMPDLLRAFVRYCHAERAVPGPLTTETLDAVDDIEPEYQRLIRSPRLQSAEALVAKVLGESQALAAEGLDRDSVRTSSTTVHRLKVTLEHSKPPIWRRLLVPSNATLGDLHAVIQTAFGWYDEHLHDFEIGPDRYRPDESALGGFGPDEEASIDEDAVTLAQVAGEGDRFTYVYDFGDNWQHRIQVEGIENRDEGEHYPACTGGRRCAPPEDVGGPWGYEQFLVAIDDPDHPDHEHQLEWGGGQGWDAAAFDRSGLNRRLDLLRLSSE